MAVFYGTHGKFSDPLPKLNLFFYLNSWIENNFLQQIKGATLVWWIIHLLSPCKPGVPGSIPGLTSFKLLVEH